MHTFSAQTCTTGLTSCMPGIHYQVYIIYFIYYYYYYFFDSYSGSFPEGASISMLFIEL